MNGYVPKSQRKKLLAQRVEAAGLPEFFEILSDPNHRLGELAILIREKVATMNCDELYNAIYEARTTRDAIFDAHPTMMMTLSFFLHVASGKMKKDCPSLYEKLTKRFRDKLDEEMLGLGIEPR